MKGEKEQRVRVYRGAAWVGGTDHASNVFRKGRLWGVLAQVPENDITGAFSPAFTQEPLTLHLYYSIGIPIIYAPELRNDAETPCELNYVGTRNIYALEHLELDEHRGDYPAVANE